MGFLDYYRQFRELPAAEVSAELRRRADERRSRELSVRRALDLTATTWWEPPHPEIVNAATFALRRAMNVYPDPAATEPRELLAQRHGVAREQVVLGHGVGELLQSALAALLHGRGGEVVVPWPAWPVVPAMVRRAGGEPVAVPLRSDGSVDLAATGEAVGERTRAVVLCSPNDPTGVALEADVLRAFAASLPDPVWLLVDEALAEFRAPGSDATGLAGTTPRMVSLRSFSKAHAMAGFRVGYAVGAPEAVALLAGLAPVQGVNGAAQAGVVWAVQEGDRLVARRRDHARHQRERLEHALRDTHLTFPRGDAPFVWLASSEHSGRTIHAHLAARDVQVMPGGAWGDDRHVRIQLRDAGAMRRLAEALREPV